MKPVHCAISVSFASSLLSTGTSLYAQLDMVALRRHITYQNMLHVSLHPQVCSWLALYSSCVAAIAALCNYKGDNAMIYQ